MQNKPRQNLEAIAFICYSVTNLYSFYNQIAHSVKYKCHIFHDNRNVMISDQIPQSGLD